MKFNFLLYLSCGALLVGCSAEGPINNNIYSVNSTVILDGATEMKLSDIATTVEFIPLETREDVLLADHCSVYFADSLLIVRSGFGGEVLIFDSFTGKYKYKIKGHKDRGPIGYSGCSFPMSINEKSREIILDKWDVLGRWNYETGQFVAEIPVPDSRYMFMSYVNDSTSVAVLMNADLDNDKSALNLISLHDGSIIKEYGFYDKLDYEFNDVPLSTDMAQAYRYKDTIGYCNYKNDTIFGVDKGTLSLTPRFVLNLGAKLTPQAINAPGEHPQYGRYMSVSAIGESERHLFVLFSYGGWGYPTVFDKKSGATVCIDKVQWAPGVTFGFRNDISGFGKFYPVSFTADAKRAYRVYQAVEFVAMVGEERAMQMGIKETDNPIVMVVTLK